MNTRSCTFFLITLMGILGAGVNAQPMDEKIKELAVFPPIHSHRYNVTQFNQGVAWGVEVNTYSGNLFVKLPLFTIPSPGFDLEMNLYYNSDQREVDAGMGPGWSFSFASEFESLPSGEMLLRHGDGREDIYAFDGTAFRAPPGVFDTLVQDAGTGAISLINPYGTVWTYDDPINQKLTRVEDRFGNNLALTYNPDGALTTVTDNYGRSVELGWSGGLLKTITEANGPEARHWQIRYADTLPVTVTGPMGGETEFSYDSQKRMNGYQHPDDHEMIITWYPNDAVSGVYIPEVGIEQQYEYEYGAQTTTLTEAVGPGLQVTSWEYNASGDLVLHTGPCCGSEWSYGYDAEKNVTQKQDALENITILGYDQDGNLITETDPDGYTFGFSYDPNTNELDQFTNKNGSEVRVFRSNADGYSLYELNYPEGKSETYGLDHLGRFSFFTDPNGNTTTLTPDAHGYPSQVILPDGSSLGQTWTPNGLLMSETDGNGNTTTHEYDLRGRKTRTNYPGPAGYYQQFWYNFADKVTQFFDALRGMTESEWDALGRILRSEGPPGVVATYSYNQKNLTEETDPNGNLTQHIYNDRNLEIQQIDAMGSIFWDYDAYGNMRMKTDREGNVTVLEYDMLNRPTRLINAMGDTTEKVYDAMGNVVAETDFEGNTTTMVLDSNERVVSEIDPMGHATTYTRDGNGNILTETDPLGNTIQNGYDAMGRLIYRVNALGDTILKQTYDANGNVLTQTDGDGGVTTFVYNETNNPISITDPDGRVTLQSFDGAGRRESITFPNGNTQTFTLDARDQVMQIQDNLGMIAQREYDANGNMTLEVSATGDSVIRIYDADDRVIARVNPAGDTAYLAYDGNGNITQVTDYTGRISRYSYDGLDRKIQSVMAPGDTVKESYTPNSQLACHTDGNGNGTCRSFDARGLVTQEAYADGTYRTFGYDAKGQMRYRIDQKGDTTWYERDAAGQLTKVDYPGPNDDVYTYTPGGRLASAVNHVVSRTWGYTPAGRKAFATYDLDSLKISYDDPNNAVSLTYPVIGTTYTRERDGRDRLSSLKQGMNTLLSYSHDLDDRITGKSYLNGVSASISYAKAGNISRITYSNPGAFWDVHYHADENGRRNLAQRMHRPTHSEQVIHDAQHQVQEWRIGTYSSTFESIISPLVQNTFQYDPAGNRIAANLYGQAVTYTVNSRNAYTAITGPLGHTPTHDANGNQTYDGQFYYFYDFEDRLAQVTTDAAGLNTVATYEYDAVGRRYQKTEGSKVTRYYYNDDELLVETEGLNQTAYLHGALPHEVVYRNKNGTVHYFHQDALGSVVSLTDALGNVAEQYEYDVFGKPIFYTAAFSPLSSSALGNNLLFAGDYYDTETGNYDRGRRHYSPEEGVYLEEVNDKGWGPRQRS
jgi:YD repeat-containing protein